MSESQMSKTKLIKMMSRRTQHQCVVVVAGAGDEAFDAGVGVGVEAEPAGGVGLICAGLL